MRYNKVLQVLRANELSLNNLSVKLCQFFYIFAVSGNEVLDRKSPVLYGSH